MSRLMKIYSTLLSTCDREDTECHICQQTLTSEQFGTRDYRHPKRAFVLHCSHAYHLGCLRLWAFPEERGMRGRVDPSTRGRVDPGMRTSCPDCRVPFLAKILPRHHGKESAPLPQYDLAEFGLAVRRVSEEPAIVEEAAVAIAEEPAAAEEHDAAWEEPEAVDAVEEPDAPEEPAVADAVDDAEDFVEAEEPVVVEAQEPVVVEITTIHARATKCKACFLPCAKGDVCKHSVNGRFKVHKRCKEAPIPPCSVCGREFVADDAACANNAKRLLACAPCAKTNRWRGSNKL